LQSPLTDSDRRPPLYRPQEALDRAGTLAAAAEASSDTAPLIELRAVELATELNQGHTQDATARADWLLETERELATADLSALALAMAAAARLATGQTGRARELLAELEQTAGVHNTVNYAAQLTVMVRTALAADDPNLARALTDRLQPHFPLHQHALTSAHAQLAEAAGQQVEAAKVYAEAAARWHEFGNVPERAHALLGQGRCLFTLEDPAARCRGLN
jgi:hypothetical protein